MSGRWPTESLHHLYFANICVGRKCPWCTVCCYLKSRQPFVPAAQQLINPSDNKIRGAALWADHRWNTERLDNTTRLRTLIPDTAPILLEWPSQQEQRGSGLTASAPLSDVSTPACRNGIWLLQRLVSVAQIRPLTMLYSTVQSIDLLMDCMAWRFWTMRQLNGCSTPASRSSAAKQRNERTGSNDEEVCFYQGRI